MTNGCEHHNDCFTCPLPDYNANEGEEKRAIDRERWRKYYEKHREEHLAKRREKDRLAREEARNEK